MPGEHNTLIIPQIRIHLKYTNGHAVSEIASGQPARLSRLTGRHLCHRGKIWMDPNGLLVGHYPKACYDYVRCYKDEEDHRCQLIQFILVPVILWM